MFGAQGGLRMNSILPSTHDQLDSRFIRIFNFIHSHRITAFAFHGLCIFNISWIIIIHLRLFLHTWAVRLCQSSHHVWWLECRHFDAIVKSTVVLSKRHQLKHVAGFSGPTVERNETEQINDCHLSALTLSLCVRARTETSSLTRVVRQVATKKITTTSNERQSVHTLITPMSSRARRSLSASEFY